jgi:N-acetylmuramoyl-L-alanine amidase
MARKATDYIVIHCSATRPSQDIDAKEIDRWHRSRGWLKIGYHYVIKRDGTVEDGRDMMDVGAHAKGYNHKSIGVAMIGGVTEEDHTKAEDNFTPKQWEALDNLLRKLTDKFPKATIIGHNEISSKECPSFDVQEWLKQKSYSNIQRILK